MFKIYLPVTRKRGEDHSHDPKILPSGTERILFVDDEAPIARMRSQVLGRLGYSVSTCTNILEALAETDRKVLDGKIRKDEGIR